MTVSVASRPILTGVSEPGRLVLAFIDGGLQWLDWAIQDPRARYHFEDESALVASVQAGLHASPFTLLPTLGLMVGPVKLMTISPTDLRTLGLAETGDTSDLTATRVAQILSAHNLVTESDFAGVVPYLKGLKAYPAPVFQCMGFADQLAVFNLLKAGQALGTNFQLEAAAFALAQGRTVPEFVDYFQAYLDYVAAVGAQGDTPAQRAALAQSALDTLLPLLFDALDCPRVEGLVAPWEVSAAIDEWLMMGRRLGFARLSQGVQQVIANTTFQQQTGMDAQVLVDAYLAGAQTLLRSADLGRGQMGQDGASCVFNVAYKGEEAEVDLGADGVITLGGYRRTPSQQRQAPAPSPPPPPSAATKSEKKS